ncbi:MAG: VWA domain-containing protein [Chloroflexota bacterium]
MKRSLKFLLPLLIVLVTFSATNAAGTPVAVKEREKTSQGMTAEEFRQALGDLSPSAVTACSATTCPVDAATPANLDSCVERTNFCVYYDDSVTTETEAETTADYVELYWDRYTSDFGFLSPLALLSKMAVWIQSGGCNGGTSYTYNYFYMYDGCFAILEDWMEVAGHELFHRVQYSYDGPEVKWFKEGTARAMQDNVYDNIDNWANALTVPYSFNSEANNYLASTNNDVTTDGMRYQAALWWKYMSEQYGADPDEPELGVDAWLALWEAAAITDDITAVNDALAALGTSDDFDTAFRRFAVANYTKDLSGLPDDSYNYVDEEQTGNPAVYGPLVPNAGGTIDLTTPAVWNDEYIARYGFDTYQADPSASDCPIIKATFHADSGTAAFYHVVLQQGDAFFAHAEGSGTDWTRSFFNNGVTEVTAIAGSADDDATVDVTLACVEPIVNNVIPNNVAQAYVGPAAAPGSFISQVSVTENTAGNPVIAGLTYTDFSAEVNGIEATITTGGFIQEQYWLVIEAPVQAADGTYDLTINLEDSSGAVLAYDTDLSAVTYDSGLGDQVLVIDRSGSMGSDDKLEAAQAAANFYVDVTLDGDGLAVVPFNGNDGPSIGMQVVDTAFRNLAESTINTLTATGSTSIGDGLDEAVNRRGSSPTGNTRCSFVLLSDGMENTSLFWSDVEAAVIATGCPVTTIAFGPESDETLMQDIATATGGLSFYNDVYSSSLGPGIQTVSADEMAFDLASYYEYAQAQTADRQRLLSETGSVPYPPVEQVHNVPVDSTVFEALFALDWNDPHAMSMRLRRPDGVIIDSATTPYTFYDATSAHLGWRISAPMPGTWQMLVTAPSAPQFSSLPYQVIASGRTGMELSLVLLDQTGDRPTTGNRVPLYAFLSGAEEQPAFSLTATVTAPNGKDTVVPLYDDGQHGDGTAGDHFFAGVYTAVNQAAAVQPPQEEGQQFNPDASDQGAYQVHVVAANSSARREALGAFAVLEGADSDADGMPDAFEAENQVSLPGRDPDLDSLLNLDEYLNGADPQNSDSDGGGENDGSEVAFGQPPLEAAGDQIEAPEFFQRRAADSAVRLTYDVKGEYATMVLYRATSDNGPWTLRQANLSLTGVYTDTATNGTVYYYRLIATDSGGHSSEVLSSVGVRPRLDPVPPEARVVIDNGAAQTLDLTVSLSFVPYAEDETGAFSDITEVQLGHDPHSFGSWLAFTYPLTWTLAAADPGEVAHVYARFRDAAGNESVGVEVGSIRYEPATLYLSSTTNGSAGGVNFGDEDVLSYDTATATWAKYLDLSDVGLLNADVDAVALLADGSVLLSLDAAFNIPVLGAVDDSDVVKFIPTSTGNNTAGTFEMYFDGSDVGLTTNNEDVDGIDFSPAGNLLVSTVGNASVPGVAATDEDLLEFTATSLGWNTAGTWGLYFDGSDVGLGDLSSEDVGGVWVEASSGRIYLNTTGAFSVSGVSGDGNDAFFCTPGSTGTTTACSFGPGLYWDGDANGFAGELLDGLAIVKQ